MDGIDKIVAISVNLCGILIFLPVLLSSKILRSKKEIIKLLKVMIIISVLGCVCDLIYVLVNGKMFFASRIINSLAKSFTYLETVLASVLFIWFVRIKINHPFNFENIIKFVTAFTLGIMVLMLASNPFTNLVFTIDENNNYSRGPMGEAGFIVAFFFCIYTATIIVKDNVKRKDYLPFPVVRYIIPFLVGGAAQLFVPQFRLSNISFVLSMLIVYQNTLLMSRYEDEIPGVYNGAYLSYFFNKTSRISRMVAYGGLSFEVKEKEQESLIYKIVDVIKNNHSPGTIIIRYEKNGVLALRENAGLYEMDSFSHRMADYLSCDAKSIETGRGVYFSNSKDGRYFLDSLSENRVSLQDFSRAED